MHRFRPVAVKAGFYNFGATLNDRCGLPSSTLDTVNLESVKTCFQKVLDPTSAVKPQVVQLEGLHGFAFWYMVF